MVVQLYLEFLDKFEKKFVSMSLELAWTLLRILPRELLHCVPAKTTERGEEECSFVLDCLGVALEGVFLRKKMEIFEKGHGSRK